jgi:hypothetical protein
MPVAIDDIAHGIGRDGPDCRKQRCSGLRSEVRIENQDRLIQDRNTGVRYSVVSPGSSLAESEAQTRHNSTIGGKMDRIDFFVAGKIAKPLGV